MRRTTFRLALAPLGFALLLLAGSTVALGAQDRSARPRSPQGSTSRSPSPGATASRHAVPRSAPSGPSTSSRTPSPHRPTGNPGRPQGGRSYRPGRYYGGYGFGYGFGYGYPYYFGHYGPYYNPWGYPYTAVVIGDFGRDRYGYDIRPYGALDLNIKPKKAEVYIDGRLVGTVDSYDGFPRYLWIEAGPHELTVVMDGYENLERSVEVIPDQVVAIHAKLAPGTAVRPQAPMVTDAQPAMREEPASLSLRVEPPDASVYLDGRFIGTAAELGGSSNPLLLDPGHHTVQVVHPDFRTERRDLDLAAGRELALAIALDAAPARPSR